MRYARGFVAFIAIFVVANQALAQDDDTKRDANPVDLGPLAQPPEPAEGASYRQRRLRADQEAAAGETWQQSFDYLASHAPDPIEVAMRSTFPGPDDIMRDLALDPRVEKLINTVISGQRKDREELHGRLRKYCDQFIDELPIVATPSKEGFQPSVTYPGLSLAFPYVLAHFGNDGSDLSVYLAMDARYADALLKTAEQNEPALALENHGRRIWGDGDLYLTVACYVSLKRAAQDPSRFSSHKQEVLRRFALWDAGRTVTNASMNTDALDFAKEFVGD